MGFGEKVTAIITGKNKEEREYERSKWKEIKKESNHAYLDAKKKESIEYAKQKAAFERKVAMKNLEERNRPQKPYSLPVGGGMGGMFGMAGQSLGIPSGFSPIYGHQTNTTQKKAITHVKPNRRKRRAIRTVRTRTRKVYVNRDPDRFRIV